MNIRLYVSNYHRGILIHTCLMILFAFCHTVSAAAEDFLFTHDPPECAVEGFPAHILFTVESSSAVQEARVYFKAKGSASFYYVDAESENTRDYRAMLPGADESVEAIEYVLLVVDEDGTSAKSPIFSVPIQDQETCSEYQEDDRKEPISVSAEQELEPENGFSDEQITWDLAKETRRETYLEEAEEAKVESRSSQGKSGSAFEKLGIGKKTAFGFGAGLGAAGLFVAIAGGEEKQKSIWDSIDDVTDSVIAEVLKTPAIQTSCGTVVTNQLFVTNNLAEDLMVGTIDYDIILTRDKPAGSCALGHSGAFAPNLATMVPPGQALLIREWMNEVNPCSGCPYVPAECQWESRYIVHTSAGSALAFAKFTSQGDLCASPAAKSDKRGNIVNGDFEP